MDEFFTFERHDGVAQLQLDRTPAETAGAPAVTAALHRALQRCREDEGVRVLVLASAGRHFGQSLRRPSAPSGTPRLEGTAPQAAAERRDPVRADQRDAVGALLQMLDGAPGHDDTLRRRLADCLATLEQSPFPVIAVVQGDCLDGALGLAAACDLRIATADTAFALPDLPADAELLRTLAAAMPPPIVRELAFTGERLDAARALGVGLVNAVFADRQAALAHALQWAGRIAARPARAVRGCKQTLQDAERPGRAAAGAVPERRVAQRVPSGSFQPPPRAR